jgi:hypothetical protein
LSKAIDNLLAAQERAIAVRPKVGGFPYLAEVLRRPGVTKTCGSCPRARVCTRLTRGPSSFRAHPWYPALQTYRRSTGRHS